MEVIQHEKCMRLADTPLQLVRDLARYYALWRSIPAGAAEVEAVFCMNTYVYDVFDTTPYALYDSATSGCGKTISLERHEEVCARAYLCASTSPAVICRRIDRDRSTFILDEAKWVQGKSEGAAEVTEIFDVGDKKRGKVARCAEHREGLSISKCIAPRSWPALGISPAPC